MQGFAEEEQRADSVEEALGLQAALLEAFAALRIQPEPAPEPEAEEDADTWAYAVWSAPGAVHLVGVHLGGSRAWQYLCRQLGGYSYRRGHRLRRAPDEAAALQLYRSESRRHGALPEPRVFRH